MMVFKSQIKVSGVFEKNKFSFLAFHDRVAGPVPADFGLYAYPAFQRQALEFEIRNPFHPQSN